MHFSNFCSRLKNLGMNTYLYAPKDDLKHRALWRDLYSPEETGTVNLRPRGFMTGPKIMFLL